MAETRVVATWNQPAIDLPAELAAQALAAGAEYVRSVAVSRTPILTGALRNSAAVTVDPDQQKAAVSYDTPYAVEQHEDTSLRHREGQSKFLESALLDSAEEVGNIIAAQVRRGMGS